MIETPEFHGRLNDLDSHIQPGLDEYERAAGEIGRRFASGIRDAIGTLPAAEANKLRNLLAKESQEFTTETIWKIKGAAAPGAFSPEGRLKTLDLMGIRRALIFADPGVQWHAFFSTEGLSLSTMRHWNDFVLDFAAGDPDRLRVAALLNTQDIDVAAAEVQRVLAKGGRAFVMASSVAPSNLSPAHQKMDRIWAMLSEARATALLHIGGEHGFMRSEHWAAGVEHLSFQPHDFTSETEQINTYAFSSFHYAPQNFVSTLVLGGVFERFPDLRFGVIELGAGWLGPLAERLDQVADIYAPRVAPVLTMKPSDYIRRNIRVTPFRFEPVAKYIERYGLKECYCFSSDFPHPEGGTAPLAEFRRNIAAQGPEVAELLFVKNGEWVLPALT